jgi:hypothetical protein
VSAAQYFRGKGGVVVAAAGNSGALSSNAATDAITLALQVRAYDAAGNSRASSQATVRVAN